jgi:hypothetical protein
MQHFVGQNPALRISTSVAGAVGMIVATWALPHQTSQHAYL